MTIFKEYRKEIAMIYTKQSAIVFKRNYKKYMCKKKLRKLNFGYQICLQDVSKMFYLITCSLKDFHLYFYEQDRQINFRANKIITYHI